MDVNVNVGVDVGNGFITATVIKEDNGTYKRENVFTEEAIPSIIVADKDSPEDKKKILFGQSAADELDKQKESREQKYYKTAQPIKTILMECKDFDSAKVKIDYPQGEGSIIGALKDVLCGFLKYIKGEIYYGYKTKNELGYDYGEIKFNRVGIAYPNRFDEDSTNYIAKLVDVVKEVFQVDGEHIVVNEEAFYIGFLLNNMGILNEGEVGMIVDVGAGTTDIAVVQPGNPGNIIARGSVNFGGNIADNIIEEYDHTLINCSPLAMIKYKNGLFDIGVDDEFREKIDGKTKNKLLGEFDLDNCDKEYVKALRRLYNTIGGVIEDKIGNISSESFKIVFTGGSCNLPGVIDSIKNEVEKVFKNKRREISVETIILDQYMNPGDSQTEAAKRNIDNETFMSYAVALNLEMSESGTEAYASEVAATVEQSEHSRHATEVSERVGSLIQPVECGAPYILAVLVTRSVNDSNGGSQEECFYTLTTLDTMPNVYTVVSRGRYFTKEKDGSRARHFTGIAKNLYFLFQQPERNISNGEASQAQMKRVRKSFKVYNLRNKKQGSEVLEDKGKKYLVREVGDKNISDEFIPNYIEGGKAVVEIETNGQCKQIDDIDKAENGEGFGYDLEFEYNYSGWASQEDKITVKYKGSSQFLSNNTRLGGIC